MIEESHFPTRRLIVFDIDGTITTHPSSWQYLHEKLRIWDGEACRHQELFRAGKISYAEFCRRDSAHWKGLRERYVRGIFSKIPYTKNVRRYVPLLRKQGFKLAAVSTGIQFLAERIENELGFEYVLANRLLVKGGRLSGGVEVRVGFGGKGRAFRRVLGVFGLKPSQAICVGDGDGDIPMMKLAGYSIAFNSKSRKLSNIVDYNCRTRDFREVYQAIVSLAHRKGLSKAQR